MAHTAKDREKLLNRVRRIREQVYGIEINAEIGKVAANTQLAHKHRCRMAPIPTCPTFANLSW